MAVVGTVCACVEHTIEIFQLLLRIWLDETHLIKSKVFSRLLFRLQSPLKCLFMWSPSLPLLGQRAGLTGKQPELERVNPDLQWAFLLGVCLLCSEHCYCSRHGKDWEAWHLQEKDKEELLVQLDDKKLELEPEAHGRIPLGKWFQTQQRYMWSQNTLTCGYYQSVPEGELRKFCKDKKHKPYEQWAKMTHFWWQKQNKNKVSDQNPSTKETKSYTLPRQSLLDHETAVY